MSGPKRGDLLIRNENLHGDVATFVVVDAVTHGLVAGPFPTLRDATVSAAQLAHGGSVWQGSFDMRGRPLGAPMRLPIRTHPSLARSA
jgi:hypothetical protein